MANAKIENEGALPLNGVLETALYVSDLAAAEKFYGGVLGLPKIFEVAGRQLVFRCQESILLIFNPDHTARERVIINGGAIPLHGARGAGHMAFRMAKEDAPRWRALFKREGVVIESEVTWANGAHSIYFRDPSGNSLELVTAHLWDAPGALSQK